MSPSLAKCQPPELLQYTARVLRMSLYLSKVARVRRKEPDLNPETSPVKTVLGSLNTSNITPNPTNRGSSEPALVASKKPLSIEEVPFR